MGLLRMEGSAKHAYSISILLTRNLQDVFGENDRTRRGDQGYSS